MACTATGARCSGSTADSKVPLPGRDGAAQRPSMAAINLVPTPPDRGRWLAPPYRCLVPFTAFAEHVKTDAGFQPLWFAPAADDPLACFAGLATRWTGVRKKAEGEVTLTVFGFLTCEPNPLVAPLHPKAMPVILTRPEEWAQWLSAPTPRALELQRPLPDGELDIVAEGSREDAA